MGAKAQGAEASMHGRQASTTVPAWRRPRFLIWLVILGLLFTFANLPRDGGPLKRFLHWAGCPWTFAVWHGDRLERFFLGALIADTVIGVAIIVPLAWLCAWLPGAAVKPAELDAGHDL